jgi:hypothetical protein
MKLCVIGTPARCATHQSGFKLLVSNGIKEVLMTTALTDRIVARYMREAQQRQAEQHPWTPGDLAMKLLDNLDNVLEPDWRIATHKNAESLFKRVDGG